MEPDITRMVFERHLRKAGIDEDQATAIHAALLTRVVEAWLGNLFCLA